MSGITVVVVVVFLFFLKKESSSLFVITLRIICVSVSFRGISKDGAIIEVNTVDGFQVPYSY